MAAGGSDPVVEAPPALVAVQPRIDMIQHAHAPVMLFLQFEGDPATIPRPQGAGCRKGGDGAACRSSRPPWRLLCRAEDGA